MTFRIQVFLPDPEERDSCGTLHDSPQHPYATCGCVVVVLNKKIRNLFAPVSFESLPSGLLRARDLVEGLDEPIKGLVDQGNGSLYSEEEDITVFACGYS